MRLFPATLALALAVAIAPASAPAQQRLPDIGSSAATVLGPAQQREYGQMLLAQLRHYDYVLDDPLVDAWLRGLGNRLAAASDQPEQSFTFFMLKDRSINAFATLGGYIGANAGLVLAAESEDEVAGVIAHEIAHVTQAHVLRGVERAQRDSVPILLAMLGAVAAASQSDSRSSGNAAMAAIVGAQGLMIQRQIDYTRSNESEADRLGMRTLARSGYDAGAMAQMFERMQAMSRTNQGGERERMPDYMSTHPVTTTRIGETRQLAQQYGNGQRNAFATAGLAGNNPLLPPGLRPGGLGGSTAGAQFGWARERLRALSADTPTQAITEYGHFARVAPLDDAQRYGLAVAQLEAGNGGEAARGFEALLETHPGDTWLLLGLAQAQARQGRHAAADASFEDLIRRMPRNRAVVLGYAETLVERRDAEAGRRAQDILRPLMAGAGQDPVFHRSFARASEIAGDPVRAGEAWAETAFLSGRAEQALMQLNTLRRRDDIDYYARARIDARIAAITPTVLELRRQGIRDPDLRK
ncbi:M48 family metalloprotease [Luteimonas terricola]|uniref:Putative beta-barrel assembly-enhancing protease n=1 Tax=Luteimonas terricola TaxID=645597 RepID=A0ABQ2EA20_9GAMM|nr:M48 family metalloprotease [Luteimonas terricola]GGK01588.1 putative beta-barrel assembly-enhancing protease [Luteimonas terricola]